MPRTSPFAQARLQDFYRFARRQRFQSRHFPPSSRAKSATSFSIGAYGKCCSSDDVELALDATYDFPKAEPKWLRRRSLSPLRLTWLRWDWVARLQKCGQWALRRWRTLAWNHDFWQQCKQDQQRSGPKWKIRSLDESFRLWAGHVLAWVGFSKWHAGD